MGKIIDFVVERAIQEKRIDLREFTKGNLKSFYEKKPPYSTTVIDFRWVKDNRLLELLITFIYMLSQRKNLTPEFFHSVYVLQIMKLPDELNGTLEDAISHCTHGEYRGNKKTFWNALWRFYRTNAHDDPFDCDLWDLSTFNLAPDRINPSFPFETFNFEKTKREDTKVLIKKYTKYNLEVTGLAVSTIHSHQRTIIRVCNMIDKSPIEFTREDAKVILERMKSTYTRSQTFNGMVRTMISFFNYLLEHDYVPANPFFYADTVKERRQYICNSVDWSVTVQIFNSLHQFKNQMLVLMYLIIYCTGMRVSEVCQLKRNCLEKTPDGYFIRYYHQKMKKDVSNVIPENLYFLIQRHISGITDKTQEYLFKAVASNGPYRTATFSKTMNDELRIFDIKNPDGTPYRYRPHAYRHTMAKRMRELNIAYQFIQEQLHHESSDMTMVYVEFLDKEKIKKMDRFIDINGNIAPIKSDVRSDDESYAEYMRKYINAQMLPNGVCARPVKLGQCPHCNSCLTCPEFRTSIQDLPVHKQQLTRTEMYIQIAEVNGWIPQIETGKAIRENLKKIISKLEHLCTKVS